MRKRMLLIVAPLCVVALAAGVAVAAPSGTDQVSDARIDNPHVVRPIAASSSAFEVRAVPAIFDEVVAFELPHEREIGLLLDLDHLVAPAKVDQRVGRAGVEQVFLHVLLLDVEHREESIVGIVRRFHAEDPLAAVVRVAEAPGQTVLGHARRVASADEERVELRKRAPKQGTSFKTAAIVR